jgi:hypothetical protein
VKELPVDKLGFPKSNVGQYPQDCPLKNVAFSALPTTASIKKQIEALKADAEWQRLHGETVARRFSEIIQLLEMQVSSGMEE